MVNNIIQATSKLGIAALERIIPSEMRTRLKMQADVSNRLCPGGMHNYAWGTQQINIAHAMGHEEAQGMFVEFSSDLLLI